MLINPKLNLLEIEGLGEFPVKIKFRDNLEVEIKLIISNEEIN